MYVIKDLNTGFYVNHIRFDAHSPGSFENAKIYWTILIKESAKMNTFEQADNIIKCELLKIPLKGYQTAIKVKKYPSFIIEEFNPS